MQKESIDLMNIEYEDVLHLYRGWRKSEAALKDKSKELEALKNRVRQLQDSHSKFRSQIQSLENVKSTTMNLQTQVAALRDENRQLSDENKELAQLNIRADELLREKEKEEEKQTNLLRDIQLDFATLKGRYEETVKGQKELEKLAADEQAMRLATEARLQASDETTESFKEENRSLRQKLDATVQRMNQCDQELLHASEQLNNLTREVSDIQSTRENLATRTAETGLLKGDIARLLHLLEASPATSGFIGHWQDSGGMDFVGIDRDVSAVSRGNNASYNHSHSHNLLETSATDWQGAPSYSHLTAETSMLNSFALTTAEFAHLKRVHGGDPFPMTDNLADEAEYWVPSEAAQLGLEFLTARIPHASPKVIMDFLRSMNKIWLRRERRKLKRVRQVMNETIMDLKRQLSQSKPYKGVLAERQIKRLKNQVRSERSRSLRGRAKTPLEESRSSASSRGRTGVGTFDYTDQVDLDELPSHERRLCRVVQKARGAQAADVEVVSAEQLLEASLQSLENMGRQWQRTSMGGSLSSLGLATGGIAANGRDGEGNWDDDNDETGYNHLNTSASSSATGAAAAGNSTGGTGGTSYPNDSYLRGALWLGRNLTVISEELAEDMDTFRTRFISEVASASQDADLRRCCHRLTLLANSGITQAHALTSKSRARTREILQGASSLNTGDVRGFKRFLRTLPIESALTRSPTRGDHEDHNDRSRSHNHSPTRHRSSMGGSGNGNGSSSGLLHSIYQRQHQNQQPRYDDADVQQRYDSREETPAGRVGGGGGSGPLFTSTMT